MGYIHKIGIENFKVFSEKQEFEFTPITLLTGTNGSGKSSVSNTLKIIAAHFENDILKRPGKLFEGDIILFDEIIKPLKNIFTSKIEFKDLVCKNSNSEIITFYLPTFIESYNNELEFIVKYSLVDGVVSYGKMLSFTLFDKIEKITLFEIYFDEIESYFLRINYLHFFQCYKEDCNNVNELFVQTLEKILKEKDLKNNEQGKYDTIQSDEKYMDLKNILFRNEEVEFEFDNSGKKVKIKRTNEMNYDYDSFDFINKQFNKKIRFVDEFCNNTINKYDILFDLNKIAENEMLNNFIEKIKSENENKTDLNSIETKINIQILNLLNRCKFEINNEAVPISPSGICKYLINPSNIIVNIVKNDNGLNDNILINQFSIEKYHFGYFDDLLSDFGRLFFSKIIFLRIKEALENLFKPKNLHFINVENLIIKRNILTHNDDKTTQVFIDYVSSIKNFPDELIDFIKKWILEFDIAEEVHFRQIENSVSIYIEKNGVFLNLADESYGKSHIISIIFKIATIVHSSYQSLIGDFTPSVLILEEPEIGLHPAFQTKLSDFFYEAYKKFNIQFLIETHSEYIIRRYQVLVAEKKVDTKEIQIHYFNSPNNIPVGMNQTYPINILSDGSLTQNFGTGFFDESSNLSIALYQVSKNNLN